MAPFQERPIWNHLTGDHKGQGTVPYRFLTNVSVGAAISRPPRLPAYLPSVSTKREYGLPRALRALAMTGGEVVPRLGGRTLCAPTDIRSLGS